MQLLKPDLLQNPRPRAFQSADLRKIGKDERVLQKSCCRGEFITIIAGKWCRSVLATYLQTLLNNSQQKPIKHLLSVPFMTRDHRHKRRIYHLLSPHHSQQRLLIITLTLAHIPPSSPAP